MSRNRQRTLQFRTWGGRRPGAGRKPAGKRRDGPSHRPRARFRHRKPCHVTLRCVSGLPNLREKRTFTHVKEALRTAAEDRLGLRIVHFSVQRNHLHLIVEAESSDALSRAVKGLEIRLAKLVNRLAARSGRVFRHRYDVQILGNPTQTRATLLYVLANSKKHAAQAGVRLPANWIDPRSSAPWFDGWKDVMTPSVESWPSARAWLLTTGWRRFGLIRLAEGPIV